MQKYFAQQCRRSDPRLAHAQRITLVDFWLEELCDEWDKNFAENGSPFGVVWGGKRVGEERALHSAEGLLANFAAGIETLMREGFEDRGPVGCPCCLLLICIPSNKTLLNLPSFVSR